MVLNTNFMNIIVDNILLIFIILSKIVSYDKSISLFRWNKLYCSGYVPLIIYTVRYIIFKYDKKKK